MYINTATKETMEKSICEVLNINHKELDDLLEDCYNKTQANHRIMILDDQYDYFQSYVKEHLTKDIDQILFVHLSRRINGDNDDNGYNFVDLLVKENSLSTYLKGYGITFKYDKYIRMFIHNKEVNLSGNDEYAYKYLKQRFGYTFQDYSFTGFAFIDGLEDNDYYEMTKGGPELLGYFYPFDMNDCLIDDFIVRSTFYQYVYLVPIQDIYFDNYDELSNQEKQYHILVKTLQRLYFYKYDSLFNENDNVVMGIINNNTLSHRYLIDKIKIEE